jgi:hypothetical protein
MVEVFLVKWRWIHRVEQLIDIAQKQFYAMCAVWNYWIRLAGHGVNDDTYRLVAR